ncbi:hypothetical protein KSZ_76520 [Dictyobacter formicarum]|uniref:Uncharacterized protein n=1 Tax=Dictyobacter formicarum TaxID=2778368 RepID=A0ABQ3VV65_9CHLR|nr:hypothetical protein KSZ_76520 [Dictyobacter formicarum]
MKSKVSRINRFSQLIRSLRVIRLLLWTLWVIYRERRRVIRARERGNYEVQPNIEVLIDVLIAFRHTAIKLGVLMIKLGQFMSTRADLLPERALAVLTSLQDEVPPSLLNMWFGPLRLNTTSRWMNSLVRLRAPVRPPHPWGRFIKLYWQKQVKR